MKASVGGQVMTDVADMDRRGRTTQTMETIFLETPRPGNILVNCTTCDMRWYRAVEGGIKVCNGFCAWEVRDAGFYDGQRGTVVSEYCSRSRCSAVSREAAKQPTGVQDRRVLQCGCRIPH